jgi:hypothetical protein
MRFYLLAILLIVGTAFGAPQADRSPGSQTLKADVTIDVLDRDLGGLSITARFSSSTVADFDRMAKESPPILQNISPEIRWIVLPPRGSAELHLRDCDVASYTSDSGQPFAATASPRTAGGLVKLGTPQIMRGIRMAPLVIMPALEEDGVALVARRMDLEIEFTAAPGANEVTRTPVISRPYEELLQSMALNPNASWLPRRDLAPGNLGRMLILRPNALRDNGALTALNNFADWKRRTGLEVTITPVDIANATPDDIRDIARGEENNPYDYLMLIGWADTLQLMQQTAQLLFPAAGFEVEIVDSNNNVIRASLKGDYYYGLFDGEDDWLPDIMIGRMPAISYASLAAMLSRSIQYEQNPFPGAQGQEGQWYNRILYASDHVDTSSQLLEFDRDIGRWLERTFALKGKTTTSVLNNRRVAAAPERTALQNGVVFAFSNGYLWGMIDSTYNAWAQTGRKHPFVVCNANYYDWPLLFPYFNKGTVQNPIGPIGALGAFEHANTGVVVDAIGGAAMAIAHSNQLRMGPLLNYSAMQIEARKVCYELEQHIWAVNFFLFEYGLLGDPALCIYETLPDSLFTNLPATYNPGATSVAFQVTDRRGNGVANVDVCIRQGNRFQYATRTDIEGRIAFTVPDGIVENDAPLQVTCMKPNYRPVILNIEVVLPQVNLYLSDYGYDDSQTGDGDGLFRNGEIVDLNLTYINDGESDGSNLSVTLFTESQYLSFSRDNPPLVDIESGNNGGLANPVRMTLSPACPGGSLIRVQCDVRSGESRWPAAFEFTTSGPAYEVPSDGVEFSNMDRGAESTVRPRLENHGDMDGIEFLAELRSLTAGVTVIDPVHRYQAIAVDGSAPPDTNFQVRFSPTFIPGSPARFELRLTSGPINIPVPFTCVISEADSSDPVGPDEYGYYAFDSGDEDWPEQPRYRWREINPEAIGGSEFRGEKLDLPDDADQEGASTVVDLPFEFRYYGRDYQQLVINSNGWVSFDTSAVHFISPNNRPIPGFAAPLAQLAVCWQDIFNQLPLYNGVCIYHDSLADVFVVEWSNVKQSATAETDAHFQIVLYNPESYPTATGDGEILFQYKQYLDTRGGNHGHPFATVGIRSPDGNDGLQYTYAGNYANTANRITDEFAIKFTTSVQNAGGNVRGRFVRAENPNAGLAGIRLSHPYGLDLTSAQDGSFEARLRPGTYRDAMAAEPGFNTVNITFDVAAGETTDLGAVQMTHPELSQLPDSVYTPLQPGAPALQGIRFVNTGNGPLEYSSAFCYADGQGVRFQRLGTMTLDSLKDGRGNVDVDTYSPALVDTLLYIPRMNKDRNRNPVEVISVLTQSGVPLPDLQFNQPARGETENGITSLTWDGTRFWGCFQNVEGVSVIIGFNDVGEMYTRFNSPYPSNVNYTAMIAYSPERRTLFAVRGEGDMLELSLEVENLGEVIHRWPVHFPGESFNPSGIAWNPHDVDDMPLYIMDRQFTYLEDSTQAQRIIKFSPVTGQFRIWSYLPNINRSVSGRSNFITIVPNYSREHVVLLMSENSQANDTVKYVAVGPQIPFVTGFLEGFQGTVPPRLPGAVYIPFDATGMPEGDYRFGVRINHNALGFSDFVSVHLNVDSTNATPDRPAPIPVDFGISRLYPNPFNARLDLEFVAPVGTRASVRVFDLTGREAGVLFDGIADGKKRVSWDADGVAAGIYLVKLEAAGRVTTRKAALIK